MPLTPTDIATLEVEREWFLHEGVKAERVRERTGLSLTRHYQRLAVLVDEPAALEHDPALVYRLRRLRDAGRRQRGMSG